MADRFYSEPQQKPLRRVHRKYLKLVRAMEKAAAKYRRKTGEARHVSVGALWTEQGPRFAYLFEKEHGAHASLYDVLMECHEKGIPSGGGSHPHGRAPRTSSAAQTTKVGAKAKVRARA